MSDVYWHWVKIAGIGLVAGMGLRVLLFMLSRLWSKH